ncbi:MAG: hypothetical protein QOH13_37 [Thermoleophilaceae bacterium]|nr:hypothetical protein [Thermoleophilaceae bacterium]
MPTRAFALALALSIPLIAAAPAAAKSKTETATSGQVTATLSYNYKTTRYGTSDFTNMKVAVTRAGVQLVDKTLGPECRYCTPWPAGGGNKDAPSIFLRDLDNDGEPEVLVDLYSGGANCCWYSDTWRFDEARNAYVEKVLRPGLSFPYALKDLNKDGVPEFNSIDYRFAYKYGSNADTPRPIRIFDWDAGKLIDVTIAYPGLAAKDAAVYYKLYLKYRKVKDVSVRGILAAYLADSYNAKNGTVAWRRVVAAYHRGDVDKKFAGESGPHGAAYLKSLQSFLKKLGYLRTP